MLKFPKTPEKPRGGVLWGLVIALSLLFYDKVRSVKGLIRRDVMTRSPQTIQKALEFTASQNARIKKIANKFMNALGLNYFGTSCIQHGPKHLVSSLNTNIDSTLLWVKHNLPLFRSPLVIS